MLIFPLKSTLGKFERILRGISFSNEAGGICITIPVLFESVSFLADSFEFQVAPTEFEKSNTKWES